MASELLVLTLVRAQAAASLAIALVLVLRGPARRRLGAGLTYRLWLLAPAAALVSPFPTLSDFLHPSPMPIGPSPGSGGGFATLCLQALTASAFWSRTASRLAGAWAVGALAMVGLFLAAELRFRRLARIGLAGPALVGVAAPRFVTPYDYRQRFNDGERDLILSHERAHLAQGDPIANLVVALFQVLFWFNPLIHLATTQVRLDQELACDALVIAGRPKARRTYAEALVKAHLSGPQSALVCAWTPPHGHASRSPLERRLRALSWGDVSLTRYIAGLMVVGGLAVGVAASLWIATPSQRYDIDPIASHSATALRLQLAPRSWR